MSLLTCSNCHSIYMAIDKQCPHCIEETRKTSLPLALLMGIGLAGCETEPDSDTKALYGVEMVDADGDTWLWDEDCDDNDPHTYPGAAEQDSETACMRDFDDDGFGDSAPEQSSVVPGTDCDDSDANVNPEAGGC